MFYATFYQYTVNLLHSYNDGRFDLILGILVKRSVKNLFTLKVSTLNLNNFESYYYYSKKHKMDDRRITKHLRTYGYKKYF